MLTATTALFLRPTAASGHAGFTMTSAVVSLEDIPVSARSLASPPGEDEDGSAAAEEAAAVSSRIESLSPPRCPPKAEDSEARGWLGMLKWE